MSLVTEFEAGDKWCPQGAGVATRIMIDADGKHWGVPGDYREARCIGSRCMAWRVVSADSDPIRKSDGTIYYAKPSKGYCGAFGKVEP